MAYQKLQGYRALAVTPSNTVNILPPGNGTELGCVLYVGKTGDLVVETVGGDTVTFKAVPAGMFVPVQVIKVLTTSTAEDIVALW